MMKIASIFCLAAALMLVAALASGPIWAEDTGNITSAYVAPDARNILLKYDGPIGKHAAFVMKNPSRLVVDIDAAKLGPVPRKIKVNQEPIDEVRLGHIGGRARLVVDFGERTIPSFKVQRGPNLISIFLDSAEGLVEFPQQVKSQIPSEAPSKRRLSGWSAPVIKESGAALRVKSANMKDNLVCVEFADRKDPGSRYRLVVDMDVRGMRVKNAALSDAKGGVKRFDLAEAQEAPAVSSDEARTAIIGPRKEVVASAIGQPSAKPKFKWGMPATDAGETPKKVSQASALHIEEFQLQPKNADPQ